MRSQEEVVLAGLKFAISTRMTMNFWCSCLSPEYWMTNTYLPHLVYVMLKLEVRALRGLGKQCTNELYTPAWCFLGQQRKEQQVSLESPHILGSLYIISYFLFVISSFTFWSWGHSVLPMLVLGWWAWESLPAQPREEVLVNKWQRHECNWRREWW